MDMSLQQIPNILIERSLALTGRPYSTISTSKDGIYWEFSIEKFCYYLLSLEFIESYNKQVDKIETGEFGWVILFAHAIYHLQYKEGNPEPLLILLQKIPGNLN